MLPGPEIRRATRKKYPRSLAVVSGKGGSGKTLVATALGQALANHLEHTLLVDADLGTGGLSYYLGFTTFSKARYGLTEYLLRKSPKGPNIVSARNQFKTETLNYLDLLPVGEHRIFPNRRRMINPIRLRRLLFDLSKYHFVIFDCRGGIDEDSLAVCHAVDDILIVIETDAAAIQSSQHLVNILAQKRMDGKIRGFILNKVLDDPSALAKAGTSFFRTDYLGAVPFDIETTRKFIRGELPSIKSLFSRHVFRIANELYPGAVTPSNASTLTNEEFGTVTLRDPDLVKGNTLFGAMMGIIVAYYFMYLYLEKKGNVPEGLYGQDSLFFGFLLVIALLSLSDKVKRGLGRALGVLIAIFGSPGRRKRKSE